MDMDMVDVDMVDVDMVNWKFGKFHIFGKFTKDHLADLSRLLGLVCLFVLVMVAAGRWKGCGGGAGGMAGILRPRRKPLQSLPDALQGRKLNFLSKIKSNRNHCSFPQSHVR